MLRTIARAALLRSTTRPIAARFSSSPFPRNRDTGADLLENLVGGKLGIARKQKEFEDKYRAALEAKAKEKGLTVEELKARAVKKPDVTATLPGSAGGVGSGPVEAGSVDTRKKGDEVGQPTVVKPLPSAEKAAPKAAQVSSGKQGDAPVKVRPLTHSPTSSHPDRLSFKQPLHDILDLSKASDLTATALSQLWTTYHQTKGFLSAAIPTETYLRMVQSARKYPIFVLPLARTAELPDGEAASATEMHLLVRLRLFSPLPTLFHEY
jgi:ATP synthase F1 complex assembly factor 1